MTHPANALLARIDRLLQKKVQPIFTRYGRRTDALLAPLKWKPLVLIIGNYSSGKSTFINELLGRPIQRVGQAPTDDSFTILCRPDNGGEERDIPGSAVIADERLPFGSLRRFGEKLAAHLWLKYVDAPILEEVAIIDTPGMLDSVTEKDRGYDYLGVVGELARLSDVIILMFDPHKAGTIKETYQAIRSTLPGSTGEDRVFYVMNRIDECENTADFVRSYGALCWNLSQMTGRKDIPRIFLTYAAELATEEQDRRFGEWRQEREELKGAVEAAPLMRLDHVFEEIDRGIKEMGMQLEACAGLHRRFMNTVKKVSQAGSLAALALFLGGDVLLQRLTGYPSETLIQALIDRQATIKHLVAPLAGVAIVALAMRALINRFILPWHIKKALANLDGLVSLDTAYRRDLWRRVRPLVEEVIRAMPKKVAWSSHRRPRRKLEKFLANDLRKLREQFKEEAAKAKVWAKAAPSSPPPGEPGSPAPSDAPTGPQSSERPLQEATAPPAASQEAPPVTEPPTGQQEGQPREEGGSEKTAAASAA